MNSNLMLNNRLKKTMWKYHKYLIVFLCLTNSAYAADLRLHRYYHRHHKHEIVPTPLPRPFKTFDDLWNDRFKCKVGICINNQHQ